MRFRLRIASISIILAFLGFISCSSPKAGIFRDRSQDDLKARVEKYWGSRLTGDLVACYELEEPGYKKRVPISSYVKKSSLIYTDYKIKSVKVSGNRAEVELTVSYLLPAFGSRLKFSNTIYDSWKKINGNWFHVYKKNKKEERR